MNKSTLDKYINSNYTDIKNIVIKHTTKLHYETDIVISNLYLHLEKNLQSLTDTNIKGYIIQYVYYLNIWKQNKSPLLTEKSNRPIYDLINENHIDEYDILNNDLLSDIEKDLYDMLDMFIKEEKLTIEEKLLITDLYKYNLRNIKDIMTFYKQRRTYGYKIKNELKQLEERFRQYIIKQIKNNN